MHLSTGADQNPYRPGVGLQPTFLAGRDDLLEDFRRTLKGAPVIPGNIRVTGLRGVGKTVLLKKFQDYADGQSWGTVNVELERRHCADEIFRSMLQAQMNDLTETVSMAAKLKARVGDGLNNARKMTTLTYADFTWSLGGDLDKKTKEIATILGESVEILVKHGKRGIVLFLDEAQVLVDEKFATGNHPLSSLIAAVSTLQKNEVPICLALCGLETLKVNLLRARTYTERMFRGITVSSLRSDAARAAFLEPLKDTGRIATPELVNKVLAEVNGYPYFIQLWGAELWDSASSAGVGQLGVELLNAVEERIYRRLDSDFFEPRIESLTPAEQDLLLVSAECEYPPLNVSDLNGRSTKSPGNVNVLLGRLVAANVIFRPRKGQYLYTAPGFRDYLQRRAARQDV